jgi:ABC-type multidrug transport system fused ATPase/permease subunit
MRRSSPNSSLPPPATPSRQAQRLGHPRHLLPYLWVYKWRVLAALGCLIGAKVANIGVPLVLKRRRLSIHAVPSARAAGAAAGALVAYGALRLSTTLFTELREFLFARVTQRAVRTIALQVFRHLHALSLRFHLNRQTGGMTRDIERGTRGSARWSRTRCSHPADPGRDHAGAGLPGTHYDKWFSIITAVALVTYITFTIVVTEWRTHFRRTMNELDSKANTKAIDSLINYETVKYFGNEDYEAKRYDEGLQSYERAAVQVADLAVLAQHGPVADHRHRRHR